MMREGARGKGDGRASEGRPDSREWREEAGGQPAAGRKGRGEGWAGNGRKEVICREKTCVCVREREREREGGRGREEGERRGREMTVVVEGVK